eukprot:Gregarina_sp_Poly_1__1591@NODE_1401_length_4217_cov_141_718795_g932_i0_p1_GENE_NODE_1401_length_4217_cov_141_718795_g932_i0NODE_1401_length_4217_cov_141_718795_g932_i0_p1_ORF_typecomplete_len631_score105_63eIF2A/PF08662_11/1_9e05eIF2A/PF08662_11/9_9e41ANAPC4_WD40/PF12894_7/6ANAPC4_WD40/PF12894_7/5_1ANAPC4_WD40/PF12894_7/3_3e02ANAPC4_WD40/PF12894_7/31ANAPC4_WD40/PF12894_7/0_17_NODE_1401_length_4217_cov_141_718795_g932_i01642056
MSVHDISLLSRQGLEICRLSQDSLKVGQEIELLVIKTIPTIVAAQWSKQGNKLAAWEKDAACVQIYNADNWEVEPKILQSSTGTVKNAFWSNTGRFLCIISPLKPDRPNLAIYEVESGRVVLAVAGRTLQEGACPLHFGPADCFVSRVVNDGILIYDFRSLKLDGDSTAPVLDTESIRFEETGVTLAAPAPERKDGKLLIAYFARNQKGSPSSIRILLLNLIGKEIKQIAQKSMFQSQEIELDWNPTGEYLLAKTHIDVDSSGKSYYGKSALYLVAAEQNAPVTTIVELAEGPVQSFCWSNFNSYHFVLANGQMPCKLRTFDARSGVPVLSFGSSRRNYIRVSGKLCCIAGFGNLPGDVDIWDLNMGKVVGLSKIPWAVDCDFSPDSYLLLASTTTPRLRVDNGIRVLRANGELLYEQGVEELYSAQWRPRSNASQRSLSPGRKYVLPTESVYRPKGAASATLSPTRTLTATKMGGGASGETIKQYLPPGAVVDKPKKKKVKKLKGGDDVVPEPVAETCGFSVIEPETETTKPADNKSLDSEANETDAADVLKAELLSLSPEQLAKRTLKCRKLLADIKRLQQLKKLNPDQKRKLERLPEVYRESDMIIEVAHSRNIDLDEAMNALRQSN